MPHWLSILVLKIGQPRTDLEDTEKFDSYVSKKN
jgi:hypothetical protein